MKKFLVILMVVAMTSFLFVGCLPTPDHAPIFTSTPVKTATVGTMYTYIPTATDADADTVTFAVAGPTGMAISAGVITWTPTAAQIGTETVVVTASDGTNAAAQTFTIVVKAASVPVLVLVGIAVDPEDMDLIVEGGLGTDTETITSVTATYEVRGWDVDIALEDCLFLTSDSEVATVDENGLVTAEGVGTADILVKYGGKFATVAITVSAVELDHIVVLPETMTLIVGDPVEGFEAIESVTAHYNDETKDEIYLGDCDYKSSDTDVAVVDKIFSWVEIWARKAGTADITVSYTEEGITETDIVEVIVSEPEPVTPVAPTIATIPDAIVVWDAEPWTYQTVATPGTGADLTYSLSGEPVAMNISATGLITWAAILDELAIHEVTVTVDAGDGTTPATDTFVISVIDPADEPPAEKSKPPVITIVPEVDNGYVNEAKYADGITVNGYAASGSLIKVYIDEVVVAEMDTTSGDGYGLFVVAITKDELDEDGPKTVWATAKQPALAESDPSNTYEFILDTEGPEIIEATGTWKADAVGVTGAGTFTVTFSEELAEYVDTDALCWSATETLPIAGTTTVLAIDAKSTDEADVVEVNFTTAVEAVPTPNVFAVIYEDTGGITDLAGNPAESSSGSCVLEIEE